MIKKVIYMEKIFYNALKRRLEAVCQKQASLRYGVVICNSFFACLSYNGRQLSYRRVGRAGPFCGESVEIGRAGAGLLSG